MLKPSLRRGTVAVGRFAVNCTRQEIGKMDVISKAETLFGLNNQELGFLVARIGLGVNLFFHGVARLPNLSGFVRAMEAKFADGLLPLFMVTPMAYVIPIAELIIGLTLLLGIGTRYALIAAAVQMLILITGCCFIQEWGPINSQMFLLVLAAVLIANLHLNRCALTGK